MAFVAGLCSRLRQLASCRALVRQHAPLLRPGLWKVTRLTPHGGAFDERLCRHVAQGKPPAHLSEAKFAHMVQRRWLGVPTMVRGPRDVVAAAAHLPLSLVWVRGPRSREAAYSLLIPAGDDVLLMDPSRGMTHRVLRTPVTDTHIEVRARLAAHVPTATYQFGPRGRWLREELVNGLFFGALGPDERSACFTGLLGRYARLTCGAAGPPATQAIESAIASAADKGLDAELADRVATQGDRLRARASVWPMVPSHGNLNGGNFVVRDRAAVLIDLKLCGPLPFFHDLLFLAAWEASMGRDDLIRRLVDGTHGASLAALWAAAGLDFDLEELDNAFLTVALVNAHHRTVTHPSDDGRSFADHAAVVSPVLRQCDGDLHRHRPDVRARYRWPQDTIDGLRSAQKGSTVV